MAAAAIPALIEAAPAIINGAMMAKGIISKYAPTAKKVAGMLFKAHKKSPSNLLSKLRGLKATDIAKGVGAVNKFIQSGKINEVMNDVSQLQNIGNSTLSSVRNPTGKIGYHNILEQLK